MPFTRYLRRKINDELFGAVAYSEPTSYYAAILTAANVDGTYTEASYTNYARIAIANNKTAFSNSANTNQATVTNNSEIFFNQHQGGSAVNVTHIGYFDAATGGNMLMFAPYTKTIETGDRLVIAANALKIEYV